MGCGKSKLSRAAPARALYAPPKGLLFKASLEVAEKLHPRVHVLSAKYGLVALEQMLEPYELSIRQLTPEQQDAWGLSVVESLALNYPGCLLELHAYASKPYLVPIRRHLPSGWKVVEPMRGLEQGERLGWLKRERARLRGESTTELLFPEVEKQGPAGYEEEGGMLLTGLERYFPSGTNTVPEIRAARRTLNNIGVCLSDMNEEAMLELEDWLLNAGPFWEYTWRLFVDTGAFGEVELQEDGPPKLVKPIDSEGWRWRMAWLLRLAAAGGKRVHIVTPDRVGDQLRTLQLLWEHREKLRLMAGMGARMVVPVMRGSEYTTGQMARASLDILRTPTCTWGIPSKKNVANPEDFRRLLVELREEGLVDAFHLLGMGPHSPRYEEALAIVRQEVPEAQVWSDSVRLRAVTGEGRMLTEVQRKEVSRGRTWAEARTEAVVAVFQDDHRTRVARARAAGWRDEGDDDGTCNPAPSCVT